MRTISIFPIFSSQKKEEKIPETSDQGDRYLFRGWFLKLNHFFLYHSYHFFFVFRGLLLSRPFLPKYFFLLLSIWFATFFFLLLMLCVCELFSYNLYTKLFPIYTFFPFYFSALSKKKISYHSQPSRELNIPIYQKKAQTSEKYFFFFPQGSNVFLVLEIFFFSFWIKKNKISHISHFINIEQK